MDKKTMLEMTEYYLKVLYVKVEEEEKEAKAKYQETGDNYEIGRASGMAQALSIISGVMIKDFDKILKEEEKEAE